MKIFLIFHNSLLRPKADIKGLPGQDHINKTEVKNTQGRVLKRKNEIEELIVKWKFKSIFNYYNEDGLYYLVKWKYHMSS